MFCKDMNFKTLVELDDMFKLNTTNCLSKYIKMFNLKIKISEIDSIIPDHFKNEKDNVFLLLEENIKKNDDQNYLKKFILYSQSLSKLNNANIDTKVYNLIKLKEKNETLKHILNTFSYNIKTKQIKKIEYELNKTITGRLVTKHNTPAILTLPKKYRTIFQSCFKHEGSLLMIDFKSLEPRIAKKLTSNKIYDDIYEEINNLSEENLDRSVIKKAVISTLYGSQRSLDNISKEKTDKLIETCKNFFKYDELIKLTDNLYKEGYRKNYFGRPIHNEEETRTHVIVNNYLQSTAVDIALTYFCNLIDLVDNEKCKAIFIIHDAIVFDVHNSYKNDLVNIVNQGYNCEKLGYFPLELTNFLETTIE